MTTLFRRLTRRPAWLALVVLGSVLLVGARPPHVAAQAAPTVRAIMFWMNGCPHCHDVIDNVLPPLQRQYGAQFDLQLVELTRAAQFDDLARLATESGVQAQQIGVPFLLIGERVLIGSAEIRTQLPLLIERHLATGGVGYPTWSALAPLLPAELAAAVAAQADAGVAAPPAAVVTAPPATVRPAPAPPGGNGFTLAIAVLIGMLLALGYALRQLWRGAVRAPRTGIGLPLLALCGLAVAAYLAYIETQALPAVCGPVGDCNAVQSSPYASLFGIPIGVLGVGGYLLILAVWGWGAWVARRAALPSTLLPAMTAFGVLFSIYLTFLEPFVIGAVCIWCLTSAVIMTLLLLLSVSGEAARGGVVRR